MRDEPNTATPKPTGLRFAGGRTMLLFAAPLAVVLGCAAVPKGGSDAAWYDAKAFMAKSPDRYLGMVRSSQYLTMRDGVKIAIDLYLPRGLKSADKIPALLHQTRYWRSMELNFPYNLFNVGGPYYEATKFFVAKGYAWIDVDARGSGASFGTRSCEWSPDEVKDGAEIVDWIIRQPWSNGKVGSAGVSYDGTTAEFLAINKHPAVKAVVPMFSLFDTYPDIAYPGGIHLTWFTEGWGKLNRQLDANSIPDLARDLESPLVTLIAKGVRPVDADRDRSLLTAAVRDHAYNWDVHKSAMQFVCRDDRIPYDWTIGIDSFSPHTFVKDLDASGAAVYSWSGWFDGGYPHAAIKRHLTLTNPKNRLILGPWNHGGFFNCSLPGAPSSQFDMRIELLRFFDYHLKGKDTGIYAEKPIHYFTMGEARWKEADTWPPQAKSTALYLSADSRLTPDKPAGDGADACKVDYTAGTGRQSRWNCLLTAGPVIYADRAQQDRKLQCYTSKPLSQDTEITGHPMVTLYVTSPAKDGNVFVYLEDVDERGGVTYITEGELRALHRKLSKGTPPHKLLVPYRTFERADAEQLVPGQVTELTFDLLPVSHLFKAGHSIRLAVAGADKDHFPNPPGLPPTIRIHRSAAQPSRIELPVVQQAAGSALVAKGRSCCD